MLFRSMLGISWYQLTGLLVLQNVPSFLIGFILGASYVYRAGKSISNVDLLFLWQNQFAILIGILVIYLISILPVIMRLHIMDPVELMVGDN